MTDQTDRPLSAHRWAARARIGVARARAMYIGPGLGLAPHRNAATTVAVALEHPFTLSIARAGGTLAADDAGTHMAALIPSNTLHRLSAHGPMLFLYLDALCDDVQALMRVDLYAARTRLLHDDAIDLDVDRIAVALGVAEKPALDACLAEVVRQLDRRPQDFVRVEQAARMAGLSPSWFQARFRRAVGMPFRRYRLWRRMAVAASALADGSTLTEAAHVSGFASSAHFSAVFREMFGLSPSSLLTIGSEIVSDLGWGAHGGPCWPTMG